LLMRGAAMFAERAEQLAIDRVQFHAGFSHILYISHRKTA
jgi:hypothetical protein